VKSLQWILVALALTTLTAQWAPQAQQSRPPSYAGIARDGYRLTKVEAEALEAALAGNPDDLITRTKLLGFYFRGAVRLYGPDATIAARRRHIVWIIEHYPGSEVSQLSEATIDAAGHALADKDGYEQAAKLWTQQAQRQHNDAKVLGNAARFFQLSDKERAAALLKGAQRVAPQDPQWSGRLGYLYAIGILGVDMMNQNGLPTSHSPTEAKAAFAMSARGELERSGDANLVGVAGSILAQYGLMMGGMFRNRFAVDFAPLAEALLLKAQELDPANPRWPQALEQFRNLRREVGRAK
jgi:tetratricopeptide (TPR) repeat protein